MILEAIGQQWNTSCDAYRITNLVCLRNDWKLVQKTSGDKCQDRKVDGILKDGNLYDCLINAGPPMNSNEPAWSYQGPQNALIPLDPLPDPIFDSGGNPNPPIIPPGETGDINQKLDIIIAMLNDAKKPKHMTLKLSDLLMNFKRDSIRSLRTWNLRSKRFLSI